MIYDDWIRQVKEGVVACQVSWRQLFTITELSGGARGMDAVTRPLYDQGMTVDDAVDKMLERYVGK